MFQNIGELMLLFSRTVRALPLAWRHRQKVLDQFFEIGNASLLMVCILSFFIGSVIALLTGPVLVERGLANSVGGLVGIAMCKELAPVMMSILIAGRVGSAMAAEIGSMRVYQEIDALRTMNINPIHYLVLPRLLSIAVALPLLVIFSILVGWGGGGLVSSANMEIRVTIQAVFFPPQIGALIAPVESSPPVQHHEGVSVKVHGLRKSFQGHEVLKGVDFEVSPGEIFVVMGPSGSGKSVLLKHVIGLETPDAGEILIDGKSIYSPEVTENYRLSMVFQSGAFVNSLTVGVNVRA